MLTRDVFTASTGRAGRNVPAVSTPDSTPDINPGRESHATLVDEAAALGIPWESILADEIRAEKTLRAGLGDVDTDWPLSCAFYLLPASLLDSWRVRERIGRLSWEATAERSRDAAGRLRALLNHLSGKRIAAPPLEYLFAAHLWSGYRRILELQQIFRVSRKCHGDRSSRIAAVSQRARCAAGDAEWAVDRVLAPDRLHVLDEAMRRARQEGFELPQARNELAALGVLKRFLARRGLLRARKGRWSERAQFVRRLRTDVRQDERVRQRNEEKQLLTLIRPESSATCRNFDGPPGPLSKGESS